MNLLSGQLSIQSSFYYFLVNLVFSNKQKASKLATKHDMTSLSEFALFKECVHNPRYLDKNLSQLNLSFIKDPTALENPEI